MAKSKKPRNYAATEATLINVRALKKQVASLTKRVREIEVVLVEVAADLMAQRKKKAR